MLLTQALCDLFLEASERKGGARGAEDTYPGIAGREPRGLHSPAGNGASGHHLGQDGPIAAFLIVLWMPGEKGKSTSLSSLLRP